jgi:hypothetical protein
MHPLPAGRVKRGLLTGAAGVSCKQWQLCLACQGCRVRSLKVVNTRSKRLQLFYTSIDACKSGLKFFAEMRAYGGVEGFQVDCGHLLNVFEGEPE